jgi:hypothetical protein
MGDSVPGRIHAGDNGLVTPHAEPAILDIHAGLAAVKAALLGLGATAPGQRSVAFAMDDHLLLLAYDEDERCTTIAVGGPRAVETAHWLAEELVEGGLHVTSVLPHLPRATPPAAAATAAAD